ncbi:MAG: fibronectin type III domain-containing protein [Flavobacteriales bacterium]|nr:fibronectin type III domain-containing protein [Flavobacteriales bacterium]
MRKLTSSGLVAKALFVETKMTGNANFTTPVPSIAAITTARGELEAAIVSAMDGGKSAHLDKRVKEAALILLLIEEAAYVTSVSGGDVVKIISSGFDVRKVPTPIGLLDAPGNLRATLTAFPGQAKLRWDPQYGAYSYLVYRKPDGAEESEWALIATETRASYTDEGLTTGKFYWFKVVAIGAAGPSPASDPAKTLIG